MNILIVNCILTTAQKGVIPRRKSIKDTMICNFAQGFINCGHSVTILASEEFRPTECEEYPFNVVYFKSRWPKIFKPHLLPWPIGLHKYIKDNIDSFDMVITSEAFSIATLMAAPACRRKLVVWQEMAMHQRMMHKVPSIVWYNVFTRLFMRKALMVARSLPAMRFISQYACNVASEIVDHGANGAVLFPSDTTNDAFIVVSQLVPRKRVDSIISKFSQFIKIPEFSNYRLNIVGDGTESDNLKQLAKQLCIDGNVVFHGFMQHRQFAEILRSSKAMLIDTINDLNMVSIPEAIVSGTPIVTNTLPTSAEFIANSGVGIARDGWDASDLKHLVENYPKYHQACLDVRDELTRDGCARKMIRIFLDWKQSKQ